jgi:hypothetical protein
MANTVVRPLGYDGTRQQLTWTSLASSGRAYLFGGGGGGGGKDANTPGGYGSGGGFSYVNFTINPGDVLTVVVGGPGGVGASGVSGQGGGQPGASLLDASTVFTTRDAAASPPVYAQYNPNYCSFLNTYGVWESNTNVQDFDRSYTVSFPSTGLYTFTASSDNSASISLDGQALFFTDTFVQTFEQPVQVTAGNHTVRIQALNTGGPGSVGLTISGGNNYSGARGGNAGGGGSSGGGGGGAGATVLLLNGTVIGVAGGGGGGGGAGNGPQGQPGPGPNGAAVFPISNGQNGTNKNGDGGGGGGGGGGYGGGNGGQTPGGDTGGQAGSYGISYSLNGVAIDNQTGGRLCSGLTYPYYSFERGYGGSGGADNAARTTSQGTGGYAVVEFDVVGAFVKDAGVWLPVENAYIKVNGVWRLIKGTYRKTTTFFRTQFSYWQPIQGSYAPEFVGSSADVGVNPREATGDAGQGGGGGGCKIICQKLAEMGFFDSAMNAADQQFGIMLQNQDPDAYNGYLRWAQPVVELLEGKGSATFRKVAFFWVRDEQRRQQMQSHIVAHYLDVIARPWAEEMAYRMKADGYDKSNPAGRFIMNIGLPMCRAIGRFGKRGELPMWAKTALIWGTTTVLLVAVSVISGTDKFVGKFYKLFKRG